MVANHDPVIKQKHRDHIRAGKMAASDMSWFFANTTPAPVSNNVFTSASRGDLISLTKAIDMGDEDIAVNGWRAVHSCAAKVIVNETQKSETCRVSTLFMTCVLF